MPTVAMNAIAHSGMLSHTRFVMTTSMFASGTGKPPVVHDKQHRLGDSVVCLRILSQL